MEAIDQIFKAIDRETGVTREQITGKSRLQQIVYARAIAAWFLRQSGLSYPQIGKVINRQHCTVIYHLRKHDDECTYNREYRKMFDKINNAMTCL